MIRFTHCLSISAKLLSKNKFWQNPSSNYMFKVNKINTRAGCEICSKLTIKTPERCNWRRSGVFIINFEHISQLVLMFLLLTLSRWMLAGVGDNDWFSLQVLHDLVVILHHKTSEVDMWIHSHKNKRNDRSNNLMNFSAFRRFNYQVFLVIQIYKKGINFNPFSTNVPHADKPGSWVLLAKCLRNTCGKVTF